MLNKMKKCFRCFVGLFLLNGILHADWNQDFDEQTHILTQQLPVFQSPNYRQQNDFFIKARERVLADSTVRKKIHQTPPELKLIVEKNDLVIKKRRRNHIHDLYAWEFSCLLGASEFVVPAFPVEIAGKRVVLQKKESFEYGSRKVSEYFKTRIQKVSLETYWKAHLLAFLLGLGDLAARNIGVNSEGVIRFFDNESSFIYYNQPMKNNTSFTTGFICHSFDWPQYRKPLDRTTAENIKNYVRTLLNSEEMINAYSAFRPIKFEEGLFFRFEKIRSFAFEEGVTFRDFYGSVYPRMSQGLDELNQIVKEILKRKVDHGSSLFYSCRWIKNHPPSPQQKAALQQWVNTYIE